MMERPAVAAAVLSVLLSAVIVRGVHEDDQPPAQIKVDDFEQEPTEEGLPPEWEELHFEKIPEHTEYSLGTEDENQFLHAEADRSASGLLKRMSFELKDYPVLKWRWRIDRTLARGDARKKAGDDYAARIYVNFKYDPSRVGYWTRVKYALAKKKLGEYPPLHTINYIWANKVEQGAFIENAYTDRAMMIAVESGDEKAGAWVAEQRNVYEDYKKAFGEEPTEVKAIAVMSDTDDTRSSASADYDDIYLERAEESEQPGAGGG